MWFNLAIVIFLQVRADSLCYRALLCYNGCVQLCSGGSCFTTGMSLLDRDILRVISYVVIVRRFVCLRAAAFVCCCNLRGLWPALPSLNWNIIGAHSLCCVLSNVYITHVYDCQFGTFHNYTYRTFYCIRS